MATTTPLWKFAGFPCYGGAATRFELPLGTAPGEGSVILTEVDAETLALDNTAYSLEISETVGGGLTIDNLYVHRMEPLISQGAGSKAVRVYFRDERWKWAKAPGFPGTFNLRRESGDAWFSTTVNSGKPWTFDELLQKVIDKLGIDLTASTGASLTVTLQSNYAPAGTVLAALLRQVPWDLARQPDGSYELVQTDDVGDWDPPQLPKAGFTKSRRDLGAERPAVARIIFKRLRAKEFTSWEPVLKADGFAGSSDTNESYQAGEWVNAHTLLSFWGLSPSNARRAFYTFRARREHKTSVAVIDRLGGGDIGHARWRHIVQTLYRVYRLSDTDRPKILPLVKMQSLTGRQTSREVFLGASAGDCVFHVRRADPGGYTLQGARRSFFAVVEDFIPPWPVRIVDPADGVVEFAGALPICRIRPYKGTGTVEEDFELEAPEQVRIIVGWVKKGSTDPDDDHFIVEKELPSPNNGLTQDFVIDDAFYREYFLSGSWDPQNESDLGNAASTILDRFAETFQQRDGERYTFVGVDAGARIDGTCRSILWETDDRGTSSTYRCYEDQPLHGILSNKAREVQIALSAERKKLIDVGSLGGGGGGGHQFGSLDNAEIPWKEHSSGDRAPVSGLDERSYSFFTPVEGGLFIVSERIRPPSGDDPCKGAPQVTKPGGSGQVTRPTTSGGIQSPSTQTSGGPSD